MPFLRTNALNAVACTLLAFPSISYSMTDSERIALLEERLLALEAKVAAQEARLAEQEVETKEVKVLAASSAAAGDGKANFTGNPLALDIMARSAWRNLRWTQEEQWATVRPGATEEQVIEALGYPPRSVDSLKPRVDKVFWYENSLRDRSNAVKGKISFKDGIVISVRKPDFEAIKQVIQSGR